LNDTDRPAALPRLSEEFLRLAELSAGDTVTLRALLGEMRPRDHALLTLMLSAAFLTPLPMPGISQMFGLLILYAGSRMARGLGPLFPKRWLDRPISAGFLARVFRFFAWLTSWFEHWVRPRGRFLAAHPGTRRANGVGLSIVGLLILVPLPPPTNFPPAIAGFVLSAGIAEDDIVFVSLGWLLVLLNIALFAAIGVYGLDGVRAIIAHLR
jgi:hypothetical protein